MAGLALGGGEAAVAALCIARATGFVVTAPLISARGIPGAVKGMFAVVFGWYMARALPLAVADPQLPLEIALPLEIGTGLAIGWILSLVSGVLRTVGRLAALQSGLALEGVFNPLSPAAESESALESFTDRIATLLLLAAGYHLAAIAIFAAMARVIPMGGGFSMDLAAVGQAATVEAINAGVRIALPVALLLIVVDAVLVVLARAIPQLNILLLGLPVKFIAAIGAITLSLPLFGRDIVIVAERILSLLAGAPVSLPLR